MFSTLIICNKIDSLLVKTLRSVQDLHPQILIDMEVSGSEALGVRKNRLIGLAAHDWVLLLDTDEVVSPLLRKEIEDVLAHAPGDIHGYAIPYQNYAFGQPVRHGGEKYAKVRLFRRQYGSVTPRHIHEEVMVEGNIGKLKGVIHHDSYRSLGQVIRKFTRYARMAAREKRKAGERISFQKLFLYGPHMFAARALKDAAWRDGWQGILLALCFAYMETLTYWFMILR